MLNGASDPGRGHFCAARLGRGRRRSRRGARRCGARGGGNGARAPGRSARRRGRSARWPARGGHGSAGPGWLSGARGASQQNQGRGGDRRRAGRSDRRYRRGRRRGRGRRDCRSHGRSGSVSAPGARRQSREEAPRRVNNHGGATRPAGHAVRARCYGVTKPGRNRDTSGREEGSCATYSLLCQDPPARSRFPRAARRDRRGQGGPARMPLHRGEVRPPDRELPRAGEDPP